MTSALVLQGKTLSSLDVKQLFPNQNVVWINEQVCRVPVAADFVVSPELSKELTQQSIDCNVMPDLPFSDLGLIVSDMDSTLITIECIDEIAAGAGLKDKVAEITERAMQGELDFEQSLRSRVALLKGLSVHVLQEVYDHVLQLSEGAEYLIQECKQHHVKFMLVSGGFTFFTDKLKQRLGLDYAYANTLEIADGKLTGQVLGRVVDAQEKVNLLLQHQKMLNLGTQQVLAMGDGANDIPMLQAAAYGVAYHAKPKTERHTNLAIRYGGLDSVRFLFR